jgi:AraC-like DNA-binding protein
MLRILHETAFLEPSKSLHCVDQDLKDDFGCPYHRHPEFEVVRIDESSGRALVGDWAGRFQAGEIYVFGGKLPHAFFNDEDTVRARSRYLQFSPDLLSSVAEVWPEMRGLRSLLHRSQRGFRIQGALLRTVSDRLDAVFDTQGIEQMAALFGLLAAIQACHENAELASASYDQGHSDQHIVRLEKVLSHIPDQHIVRLEKVLSHIHDHPRKNLPMESLAQKAGMSVSAFHNFFRKRMGCTPGVYILDVRFSAIARRPSGRSRSTLAVICTPPSSRKSPLRQSGQPGATSG